MLFRICRISLFSQNRQCISSMYMRPVVYLGEAIEVAKRVFMNGGMLAWACCDESLSIVFLFLSHSTKVEYHFRILLIVCFTYFL